VKRISVEDAPNVLTVHLKRFEYGGFGAKITKKVDFGTRLDLRPYMSNTKGPQKVRLLFSFYGFRLTEARAA
jgi:ubiquitin carboxyl-terminal hydrolase 36/42